MPIEIGDAPVVSSRPGFAGDVIRVPLNEQPDAAWLEQLKRQQLPGKAYRLDGAAIEFYLDRDTRDIGATMKKLTTAIQAANEGVAQITPEQTEREQRNHEKTEQRREKINRLLLEWWNREREKRERQLARLAREAGQEGVTGATEGGAPTATAAEQDDGPKDAATTGAGATLLTPEDERTDAPNGDATTSTDSA